MTAHCKPFVAMKSAEEIVLLVRVVSFEDAVKLIEDFARHHQSAGRLDHAVDLFNRVSCGMESKP